MCVATVGTGVACQYIGRTSPAAQRAADVVAKAATLPGQSTGVFTPAHQTFGSAVNDFFWVKPDASQPIEFPHKIHVEKEHQAARRTVTRAVTKGPRAGLPSVNTCLVCHASIATDKPLIKQITAMRKRGSTSPGSASTVTREQAHVRFNHAPHIRAKVECATCHGDIAQQTRRPAQRQPAHGLLRELPSREASAERVPHMSLLGRRSPTLAGMRATRWIDALSSSSPQSPARARRLRAAAIPSTSSSASFRKTRWARHRRVEAERLSAVRERLRSDRPRDGRRRRGRSRRPGGRHPNGRRQETRREPGPSGQPGPPVLARPGGDPGHVSPRSHHTSAEAQRRARHGQLRRSTLGRCGEGTRVDSSTRSAAPESENARVCARAGARGSVRPRRQFLSSSARRRRSSTRSSATTCCGGRTG